MYPYHIQLLCYVQLFGGLWYFFAIWKKMRCWYEACREEEGCTYAHRRFLVNSTLRENNFLDDTCYDISNYDFALAYETGIFKDALLSNILDSPDLATRLLYCFRWAIDTMRYVHTCQSFFFFSPLFILLFNKYLC